jgi:hypothetical protein
VKIISISALILFTLVSCNQVRTKQSVNEYPVAQFIDSTDMTNNFYDNTPTYPLPLKEITVEGEIENPGKVDLSALPLHSVNVKETLLDSTGSDKFTGAFRYDGYSLFDILERRIIKKANASEFSSVIDLYIEIENDKGEKALFSWGEIFYPDNLHKIILAGSVSRIVPSRTKDLWVLPTTGKIVAASDLITERNISNPVKITVRSFPKSFKTIKGLSPMYSGSVNIFNGANKTGEINSAPSADKDVTFNTIFYGRGKGIHSTSPFTGVMLKDLLQKYYPLTKGNIKSGMMCFAGQDGYRCAVSYSELFNRNDQQEFLLITTLRDEDGGMFRMFPAADFFSDRAIKSLSEIYLNY